MSKCKEGAMKQKLVLHILTLKGFQINCSDIRAGYNTILYLFIIKPIPKQIIWYLYDPETNLVDFNIKQSMLFLNLTYDLHKN